jgi:ribosomal protein S18 acetylase RimI-like enzyme
MARCFPFGGARLPVLKNIEARPIETADLDFLQRLFASTRAEEIAAAGWPPEVQAQFLAQQFDLQHRYYQEHYADADFWLLLCKGKPVGRLYWWAHDASATLIDISLLPEERGQGVGTALLALLTAQADGLGQSVSLHVEPANPARRLYARFGFDAVADNGVYIKMRRPAPVHTSEKVFS